MRAAFIYLASQSPRRLQLLEQLGVAVRPLLPEREEDSEALETKLRRESALHYVQRVTVLKAGAAVLRRRKRQLPEAPILVADTTVVLGQVMLGKPQDAAHALQMLHLLSGRTHRVLTAVALTRGQRLDLLVSLSAVTWRATSLAERRRYVASGEPMGKAGGYAIQGRAAEFITRIVGSHSGIMGLPLAETAQLLRQYGVDF